MREPRTHEHLLMDFLALPDDYVDICQTSDGYFLARGYGEVGYNHFLGKPSLAHEGPGKAYRRDMWHQLTFSERKRLVTIMRGAKLSIHTALRDLAQC